jgi:hypothetical protein
VGQSRLQVSDEQWQLQVEVGGTGGRWSAKAAKKQVGQSRLQVSAVTVLGRDRNMVAKERDDPGLAVVKKGDDAGEMSSGSCKWRSEVQVAGGGRKQPKKKCDGLVLQNKGRQSRKAQSGGGGRQGREEQAAAVTVAGRRS